jgi:hypothetical protein
MFCWLLHSQAPCLRPQAFAPAIEFAARSARHCVLGAARHVDDGLAARQRDLAGNGRGKGVTLRHTTKSGYGPMI